MRHGCAIGLAAALAACASAADAQAIETSVLGSEIPPSFNRGRNVSVLEREHPEYAANGLKAGGFTVFPVLETGLGYLSNVFATQTNPRSDAYAVVDPSLTARSDWSRHQLILGVGAQLREFVSHPQGNEEGWFLTADGRLDIDRDDTVTAGAEVRQLYEERDSGDFPSGTSGPLPFIESRIFGRASHEGGRVRLVGAADVSHFGFGDVPALGGGTIAEGDRDRTISRLSARGEYAFNPDASAFAEVGASSSDYDGELSTGAPNRSSREYRVLGGASFDLTALARGVVAIGYIDREYQSGLYRDVSGFAFDARVEYFPTPLTTLALTASRRIEDAVVLNSGGYFNSIVALRADHELLRNLLLHARLSYENDDFQGVSAEDDIVTFEAGAIYLANRGMAVKSTLAYVDRTSSGDVRGPQFEEFRAVASVVLKR